MADKAKSPNVGFTRKGVVKQKPRWSLVDDVVGGEDMVKDKGEKYLPKPETNTDPEKNKKQYDKYKLRAVFFPVTGRTLDGLVGQVFSKDISTDLQTSQKQLEDNVDGSGITLEQQAKQSLELTLKHGRAGLLSDFPNIENDALVTKADLDAGRIRPRIILYQGHQIINWRETSIGGETFLSLLVLQEEKIIEDDGFEFKCAPRWRVLRIDAETGNLSVQMWKRANDTTTNDSEFVPDGEEIFPTKSDGTNFDRIPFSFIGSKNNDSTVDEPPLYPLACLNVAHYRNSADYEQSLFITGQPTPVFTGLTEDWLQHTGKVLLGSQNAVSLPVGASAELLQAKENTMPMEGMGHKEDQMKAIGAKLIEPGATKQTATEAEIEETSEASILSSLAKNVSAAYERAFFFCSLFSEEVSEEDISIKLNSEFQVMGLNAQERQEVIGAWQAEILTWKEAREVYRRKGIATESDEDAKTAIENAQISLGGGNVEE